MYLCHPSAAALLFTVIAHTALAQPVIQSIRPDGAPNKAVWMAQGSFGVMTHYLLSPEGATPEEKTISLNRMVDDFNVDAYVGQIEATGADWVIFTLMQGTGFLSSHSDAVDKLQPGITPRRDLIPELAMRLHERGKRLIVYLPSPHTGADPVVKSLIGLGTEGYLERHDEIVRELSLKGGKDIDGWWFDSCGPQDNAAWQREMDVCRAGNTEAVVAFSGAEFCAAGSIKPLCPIEDYHAGEIHLLEDGKIRTDFVYPPGEESVLVDSAGKLRKRGQEARFYMPDAQFIDSVQWHGLLPIDLTFNPAVPNLFCHYTDEVLFKFVDDIKRVGGAITINVPIDTQYGQIPNESHGQLVRLGQHLKVVNQHGGK